MCCPRHGGVGGAEKLSFSLHLFNWCGCWAPETSLISSCFSVLLRQWFSFGIPWFSMFSIYTIPASQQTIRPIFSVWVWDDDVKKKGLNIGETSVMGDAIIARLLISWSNDWKDCPDRLPFLKTGNLLKSCQNQNERYRCRWFTHFMRNGLG